MVNNFWRKLLNLPFALTKKAEDSSEVWNLPTRRHVIVTH